MKVIIRQWSAVGVSSALLLALSFAAEAQQMGNVHRIGWLTGGGVRTEVGEAFRQGLRDLSYIEGKNIAIDWRIAQGKREQVASLAAELVRLKVDVIVTGSATDTRAAKAATATIPIVMMNDGDPVGMGLSTALPGRAVTSPAFRPCRLRSVESGWASPRNRAAA